MQGAEERRLRRMNYTPQGGAIEGNAADDILMVNQGSIFYLTLLISTSNIRHNILIYYPYKGVRITGAVDKGVETPQVKTLFLY